jgi:hypothetical protein
MNNLENPDVSRLIDHLKMRSQSENRERVIHDYLHTLDEFAQLIHKSPSEVLDEQEQDDRLSRRE